MEKCSNLSWTTGIFLFLCALAGRSSAQTGCVVSVDAGPDTTFCMGNQAITLSAQISGDYLDAAWTPVDGLSAPGLPVTNALVDNTITYTIQVRSLSNVNLIINGNFSQGDVGFTSSYIYGTGGSLGLLSGEGQYAIDDDPADTHRRFASCGDHTTGSGNMMIVNASGQLDAFWCQSLAVNQGTAYDFSAWVASVNDENPAQLQFSINGDLLGSQFNSSGALCDWEEFSAQWVASASATVEICVVNVNLTPAGNDFALDDIAFREICVATDSVTLTVARLNADWTAPAALCRDDQLIMLNDLLAPAATPGGAWTLDGLAVQSLDPSKLSIGQHALQYTVTQDQCVASEEHTINILQTPYAGAPGETYRFCQGDQTVLILSDELTDEDSGGAWAETSTIPGPATSFDPLTSSLQIDQLPAGAYTYRYQVGAGSPCGLSENEIRILISALPAADLGPDRSLNCDDQSLTLGTSLSPNSAYDYAWTDQSGALLGDQPQLTVDAAGIYTLQVTDRAFSCQNQDQITISENLSIITAAVQATPARCFDSNDGLITVGEPAGGTEPYLYSLNNSPFSANAQFANLAPGSYELSVMDAVGCTEVFSAVVSAPSELQVVIQADQSFVNLGDSIQLELLVNNPVGQIVWNPAPVNCANCQTITVSPAQSTTYTAAVTDANGCRADARLTVQVRRDIHIFVPNAFSPNEDGVNDLFYVNAAEGIRIVNLQVVDRWGNTLFQRDDIIPNDPGQAWDGRIRGQLVPSGVLVYALEVELPNGERVIRSGELAVIY